MYLRRTLRVEERDWILIPSAPYIGLCLLLPRNHPRGIMALGHSDACMAEQYCYSLQGNSDKQQFGGKSIAKPMCMPAWKFSNFKKLVELPLPVSRCCSQLSVPAPKNIFDLRAE